MSSEIEIAGIKISGLDWDATPESVKAVVIVLSERLAYIEEQLQQNSQNSSRPPSSDGFAKAEKAKVEKQKKSRKKPSNVSDSRKTRKLYPIEACKEVYSHVPEKCRHCGEELSGEDAEPYRHQILEIPTLSPYVIEHRQHQLECVCCERKTRAALPRGVPITGYGDRLAAVVGWFSGEHRQSHRMVESLMATLFNVELSRGSINRLPQQVSEAVAEPVELAQQYVQGQEVVHSDETSFRQGNGDGLNPKQSKGWLWVVATRLVKIFSVALSRAQTTAKALLGEAFKGILISDRYPAYNWLDEKQRRASLDAPTASLWNERSSLLGSSETGFNGDRRTQWSLETNWSSPIKARTKVIPLVASSARWYDESPSVDGSSGVIESWI